MGLPNDLQQLLEQLLELKYQEYYNSVKEFTLETATDSLSAEGYEVGKCLVSFFDALYTLKLKYCLHKEVDAKPLGKISGSTNRNERFDHYLKILTNYKPEVTNLKYSQLKQDVQDLKTFKTLGTAANDLSQKLDQYSLQKRNTLEPENGFSTTESYCGELWELSNYIDGLEIRSKTKLSKKLAFFDALKSITNTNYKNPFPKSDLQKRKDMRLFLRNLSQIMKEYNPQNPGLLALQQVVEIESLSKIKAGFYPDWKRNFDSKVKACIFQGGSESFYSLLYSLDPQVHLLFFNDNLFDEQKDPFAQAFAFLFEAKDATGSDYMVFDTFHCNSEFGNLELKRGSIYDFVFEAVLRFFLFKYSLNPKAQFVINSNQFDYAENGKSKGSVVLLQYLAKNLGLSFKSSIENVRGQEWDTLTLNTEESDTKLLSKDSSGLDAILKSSEDKRIVEFNGEISSFLSHSFGRYLIEGTSIGSGRGVVRGIYWSQHQVKDYLQKKYHGTKIKARFLKMVKSRAVLTGSLALLMGIFPFVPIKKGAQLDSNTSYSDVASVIKESCGDYFISKKPPFCSKNFSNFSLVVDDNPDLSCQTNLWNFIRPEKAKLKMGSQQYQMLNLDNCQNLINNLAYSFMVDQSRDPSFGVSVVLNHNLNDPSYPEGYRFEVILKPTTEHDWTITSIMWNSGKRDFQQPTLFKYDPEKRYRLKLTLGGSSNLARLSLKQINEKDPASSRTGLETTLHLQNKHALNIYRSLFQKFFPNLVNSSPGQ